MSSYRPPTKQCMMLVRMRELNLLSDVIRHLARRHDLRSKFGRRCLFDFEAHLEDAGLDNGSIVLQEDWALLHDVRGNVRAAVRHRERLIELVEHLFEIGGPHPPIDHRYLLNAMRTLRRQYNSLGQTENSRELARRIAIVERTLKSRPHSGVSKKSEKRP